MDTKRKMAGRLLKGDGVDKDEAKAVSLLEDCVAHGDTDAMVLLAKCCALGLGTEHGAERAEALISEAAEKGNDEARILMQLINDWKGKEPVYLRGLRMHFSLGSLSKFAFVAFAERVKGECTIERVTLVMNIVSCRDLDLSRQALDI